jgi:hypothetical protein
MSLHRSGSAHVVSWIAALGLLACSAARTRVERSPAKAGSSALEDGGAVRADAEPAPDASPADAPVPMKNGAPIGDCVEASEQELAKQGCPTAPPPALSSCEEVGTVCRYEIETDSGASSQVVFACNRELSWGAGASVQCGITCHMDDGFAIELSAAGCASRSAAPCDDGKGTTYAFPPPAYTLASAMLQAALEACDSDIAGNSVELQLSDGCPVRLASLQTLAPAAVSCLESRLGQARWQCATQVPCLQRSWHFGAQSP